jgi:hypothetical protein
MPTVQHIKTSTDEYSLCLHFSGANAPMIPKDNTYHRIKIQGGRARGAQLSAAETACQPGSAIVLISAAELFVVACIERLRAVLGDGLDSHFARHVN